MAEWLGGSLQNFLHRFDSGRCLHTCINSSPITQLYTFLHQLKQTKRAGWVRNGVQDPESVAAHSFSLAILAMLYAKKRGLSVEKAIKIALVHDLGESVIGDITPHDGITKKQKHEKELRALNQVFEDLEEKEELLELWHEFEHKSTPEGKLVAELDKLDAYLQAKQYKLEDGVLEEFFDNAFNNMQDPEMLELLKNL